MTARLTALIVDDEAPARRTLRLLLAPHGDIEVVAECADGLDAISRIRSMRPDLVFLDVQIPGADGFEVVARLPPQRAPAVIFVTAFERYALKAFEAHAVDYLLKPFSDDRFLDVLEHARRAIRLRRLEAGHLRQQAMARDAATGAIVSPGQLVVRDGHKTLVIPWRDIEWIEAEDYYSRIHAGPRRPLVRRTLRSLLDALAAGPFVRVHRSAIVNVGCVRELRPVAGGDAEVRLASGVVVRVSRSCREALAARLDGRSGVLTRRGAP
jgi:two-component system LytT family response regulator